MDDGREERPFEVVLWGATGFTGKLVAEYLARHGPGDLKWAIAGRSQDKLEGLRRRLSEIDGRLAQLPILTGESHDTGSLAAIASQARVVCSTVGPYAKYGSELVAACVEHGTSYCDLTGEPQWIRHMIDAHHERAQESGARIVHCCGFDSIPSDLGVWMMQKAAEERHGRPLDEIKLFVVKTSGGFSGGTAASMLHLMEEATRDPSIRKVLGHPYGLNPKDDMQGPDGSDPKGVGRDLDVPCFTAPFIMGVINTRVVRRSNAILGHRYGRAFRYSEKMSFPYDPKGLALALGVAGGVAAFTTAAAVPISRQLLEDRVLPKPGEGPSKEQRDAGCFELQLVGRGRDADGAEQRLDGRVEGTSDPGYGETAKMISEAILCLARDPLDAPGGVLTPAAATGDWLLERLRSAGMVFEVR